MDKTSLRSMTKAKCEQWLDVNKLFQLLLRNAWSPHLHWERFKRPLENSIECIYSNGLGHFHIISFHMKQREQQMSLVDLIFPWEKRRGPPLRIPNE